jgi:hypothetical protein
MTPAERAEQSAMMEAELERYLHLAELRKLRKERTTPEQRARKAAQDDTRKLRGLLREAAEANRWARIETALDGPFAFEWRRRVDALRDKVKQRTARVYARAAAGCMVSAEFIADDEADALYTAAFNSADAEVPQ